jgi:hypothetical protein
MLTEPYYPIGIQDFAKLRSLNAIYVDKTGLIYKLVHTSTTVFLSRPRRFGKSLLSSTLQYYFEGRKDLFTGLAMERLETEWTEYPVLHFDLSMAKGKPVAETKESISRQLKSFEAVYGADDANASLGDRLSGLIQRAYAKTGQQTVVLIDEYDAPILDVLHDDEKREEIRMALREFYSPLKACDRYLRFVFITGISMFSQLSIFSELNNLNIISRVEAYSGLCGITKKELVDNFQYGINELAGKLGCTADEVVEKLTDRYDGYHFCEDSEGVFNPYSLLNALGNRKLENYWFRSGTPRFLIEMLRKYQQDGRFDVKILDSTEPLVADDFESPLELQSGPIPLLYQAGYLTISGYDAETSTFTLAIPNSEVRIGLLQNLLPMYANMGNNSIQSVTARTSAALRKGDVDQAMQLLQSMLSSMPFMSGDNNILQDAEKTEAYYHRIFYFFFRMLYNEVYAEVRSAKGATDVVIFTPKYIYIVEIKIDSSAETALQQINDKGYAQPYLSDGRKVTKLGINFSTEARTIDAWLTE